MGGHPWYYSVPYVEDIAGALSALREREFRAGRYYPAEKLPRFPVDENHAPGCQHVSIFFDPGFPRQLDYGYRNWLKPDLLNKFPPLGPRDIIPAITNLNYEVLWRCEVTSTAICWDVITEANIEQTLETFVETLDRLYRLAARVNALEV